MLSGEKLCAMRCICRNAFKASAFVYTVAPASLCAISSTVMGLWCSLMMALFKLLGSRHTLTSPFGFLGNVTEETHGVGSTYSVIISSSIKKSSSLSIASFDSIGTFLLACVAGLTVGSTLML